LSFLFFKLLSIDLLPFDFLSIDCYLCECLTLDETESSFIFVKIEDFNTPLLEVLDFFETLLFDLDPFLSLDLLFTESFLGLPLFLDSFFVIFLFVAFLIVCLSSSCLFFATFSDFLFNVPFLSFLSESL